MEARNINHMDKFKEIFEEEIKKITFHYGHPYLNSATLAGVIRMALKKYR
ncbi:hypothetical protein [Clostridium sp. UBA6640]|nr:hypothetical protein [Clostridium sp. UBA6640]